MGDQGDLVAANEGGRNNIAPPLFREDRLPKDRLLSWAEYLLVGCPLEDENFYGASQEYEIQPYRPIAHVVRVHPYPLFEGGVVASCNLPGARHPGRYSQHLFLGA